MPAQGGAAATAGSAGGGAAAGLGFDPEPRGAYDEEERHFLDLPSTRANYIELEPTDAGLQVFGDGDSVGPDVQQSMVAGSSTKAASGAARSARRLGGKIAGRLGAEVKRSREVSANLVKQAHDLGKQAGAVAARQTTRQNQGNAGGADAGGEEGGVFEIGSDEEEELFAGSGSDMVSGEAEAEETSSHAEDAEVDINSAQ